MEKKASTRQRVIMLLLSAVLVLTACSGNGDNSSTTEGEFGLNNRESLTQVNLPLGGAVLGTFSLVNAYPGLSFRNALYVTAVPGENRLVAVLQSGEILAFVDDDASTESNVILDLGEQVLTGGEQGLLGMAFDPAFESNRYLYLYYSRANPRRSVVSRMTWPVGAGLIDSNSEKVLLEIDQPFSNHNGGMLAFGPDDFLYVAVGDGGSGGDPQNHAQNRQTLLGSILRVDVHPNNAATPYDIPTDNPFVAQADVRAEIFAYGLRNPFRFSFDRQTGELWAGDVGQNAREEINLVQSGGNYGWRVLEGTLSYDDTLNTLPATSFIPPVFEYDHSSGVSIIGGYVYRGTRLGSLIGRYLYADFSSGSVWALTVEGDRVIANNKLGTAQNPTSFGETKDGDVLVVTRNNGIYKLEPTIVGGQIPNELSQTGLFTSVLNLTPASGMIEYTPQQAFWSDGAVKRRWAGVPDNRTVAFTSDDWELPVGAITVKHFEIALIENDPDSVKRLETRVFIHTEQGWQGFTYRWNSTGTDATLIDGRETELLSMQLANGGMHELQYEYPASSDCLQCHTQVAGFTLGLTTRQMNSPFMYPALVDNQLRSWNNIDLFSHDADIDPGSPETFATISTLDDESAPVAERARDYLEVNCSHCHRPGGNATTNLDLRAATEITDMNAVEVQPSNGNLGIENALIIASASKERSILWQRMRQTDQNRMPPLSSHVIDNLAVSVIGQWIDSI